MNLYDENLKRLVALSLGLCATLLFTACAPSGGSDEEASEVAPTEVEQADVMPAADIESADTVPGDRRRVRRCRTGDRC